MAADLAAAAATTEVDYEEQEEATVMKLLRRRLLSKVPRYRNGSGFRVNGGQSVTLTFPGTDSAHNPISEGSSSGGGGGDVDGGVTDPLNCSVYLDELHGKWKCHHCNWTYFVGSSRSGGLGSHPKWRCRHCNSDPSTQSLSVDHGAPRFSSEIKGAESINGAAEKNGFPVNGLRQQSEGVLENGRLSPSSLTSLNGSVERRKGVAESDVEMLLEKQDTHDLYCPDCSSCITQRVVLNIRKQNTPNGHVIMEENKHFTTPKGNAILEENEQYTSNGYAKLEENTSKAPFHPPVLDAEPTHPADDQVPYIDISAYNGSNPAAIDGTDGQQDVFRCLSCFRFFIPEARASSRPQLGSQRATAKPRGGGGGEGYGWEILKCVVFGGLIESITSLGVVSSAAGAGAPTLNVLVMGLANVIGGLVIIANNLLDLKQDHTKATTSDNNNDEAEDRYQTTLGKRENFGIHFMAAILSFLVCGLLPTFAYGFTFQSKISSNGNKDEKLAVAGSASLVCIILLAIAKAHTQKQQQQPKPYAATVLYFFCIWMATSGICYLVGDLIKNLITPV
ncbi:unnamed protein product [Linum tenue]|uniref:Uncharacterized protein n=1 Tax=Linum tenue TaxID=586396 RepID=A0AAV0JJM8_9ROSI|nr:unnamed protein product [Linum tenue]